MLVFTVERIAIEQSGAEFYPMSAAKLPTAENQPREIQSATIGNARSNDRAEISKAYAKILQNGGHLSC